MNADDKRKRTWTEDRVNGLKVLWDEGLSASKIARALGNGLTRNAVIGKAHRLGLLSRPSIDGADPFLGEIELFAVEGRTFVGKLLADLEARSSNQPPYPQPVINSLSGLQIAFERLLLAMEEAFEHSEKATSHVMRQIGEKFAKTLKKNFASSLVKLKREAGFVALVGLIGYLITLTGNDTLASSVVAMLLGTEIVSNSEH